LRNVRSKGPMSRSPQHQMLSKMRRHPTTPRRVLSSFLARDALVRTNNQRIVALLPRCSYTSVCLRRHPRPQGITGNYREYIFRKIPPEIPQYLASFCIYFYILTSGTFLHIISVYFRLCSMALQCLRLHHVNSVVMVVIGLLSSSFDQCSYGARHNAKVHYNFVDSIETLKKVCLTISVPIKSDLDEFCQRFPSTNPSPIYSL